MEIRGNCLRCGKSFVTPYVSKKFCSKSCGAMYRTKQVNPMQHMDKVCERCGSPYRGVFSSKFCSKECLMSESKKCKHCGKSFKGHHNSRYCSMACKDAYKVRKDTGERKTCIVCGEVYKVTYGKKSVKKQVCSVKCGNIYFSKLGKEVTLQEIEALVSGSEEQFPLVVVADILGVAPTTIQSRAKERYGSYRKMVAALRGYYDNTNTDRSLTANALFELIDTIYSVKGTREMTFDGLVNPATSIQLRFDYYLKDVPLVIEYHGIQHYKEIEFFDKVKGSSFADRSYRDNLKVKYLKTNNIPLVIFNYLDQINETTIRQKLDLYLNR